MTRSGCRNDHRESEIYTEVESLYLCVKWEWEWRHNSHSVCLRNISTASKCCADKKEMLKLCIFILALRPGQDNPLCCEVQPGTMAALPRLPFQTAARKILSAQPRAAGRKRQKARQERVELMEAAVERQSKSSNHRSGNVPQHELSVAFSINCF